MTDRPALILGLLNLAVIGALPRIFFRRGRLTAGWWLTASPFLASAVALLAALSELLEPVFAPHLARATLAVVLHGASLVMIGYTLGTHREPLSLWHQPRDTPRHIVTHGAYARIRHPFYSSFVLALLGAAVALPHWLTMVAFVFGFAQLYRTAAREEAMLIDSPFSAEYRAYLSRSGRFWPRGRRAAAVRTERWSR